MNALETPTKMADVVRLARPAIATSRFVKLPLAESATGYSVEAMNTKIKRGVWLEGHEYIRAPDGSLLVDMVGYELWAVGQRRAG